jgi:hypothetical protein
VADLLTHGAVAVLAKAGTRWRMVPVFVGGTLAPDLFSRVPALSLGWVHTAIVPLPPVLTYGWDVLHQPVGMVVLAYLLALFFDVAIRASAFLNLLGGMFLHLAIDLLQHHYGAGYLLLYPFSDWDVEIGWLGSEDTVWAAPFLVAAAVWAAKRRTHASHTLQHGTD